MLVLKPSSRDILRNRAEEGVFVSLGARVSDGYDGELTDTARSYRTGVQVGRGREGVELYLIDQRSSACIPHIEEVCAAVVRRTQQAPNTPSLGTVHVLGASRQRTLSGAQFSGTGITNYTVRVERRVGDSWMVRVSRPGDNGPFMALNNNSYQADIELLYRLNITNGCRLIIHDAMTQRYYCPTDGVTRAHMALFLVRSLGEEPVPKSDPRSASFRDVPKNHWAWGYIEKLKDLGITKGCGRTGRNYCPTTQTTRAHTAVFLVRALGQTELSTTTETFGDVDADNPRTTANEKHWAHGYIERMQRMGIAVTCPSRRGRNFCPDDRIRRDVMARFLTTAILTLQEPTTATPATTTAPPGQPSSPRVSNQLTYTWTAPASSGTANILAYDISYGIVNGQSWMTSVGNRRSVSLANLDLDPTKTDEQVFVRVRTRSSHGASDWSAKTVFTAPTTTTTTTTPPTTTTTTAPTTATTALSSQPVTVWQIETRPSKFDTAHREVEFALTSGNTFTYAGRTYTISSIKTYNRAPRIQVTPDLEDHELPDRTLIRFWPTDTPASVQTIRLSDGNQMPDSHQWDLIWSSASHPIDLNRNTTWHIDLTIPAPASSTTTTAATTTTTTTTTPITTTTTTTTAPTTTTTTAPTTATTAPSSQPVTVWQIETRPSKFDTAHREVEFALTSGNTFTYAGRTYTISSIKTYNRAPRIQVTPDLEDHELPDRTLIRFWPTDTPASVQTIRLSDGNQMPDSHQWDLIWSSASHPIDLNRNTTWHIDLTIPAPASSTTTTTTTVASTPTTTTSRSG